MKNFKWTLPILVILMSPIWNYSCRTEQNKNTSTKQDSITSSILQDTITSSILVVTGIVTYPDGTPAIDRSVDLMFGEGVLKIGEGGVVLNPTALTDSIGHYKLEIEIDSLKEFDYSFTIHVGSGIGGFSLVDENKIPVIITVDPKVRQFDIDTMVLDSYIQ